jgi:hypothetical protein
MRAKKRGEHSNTPVSNDGSSPATNMRRRGFLLTLGVGGAGAAAVAARSWTSALPTETTGDPAADGKGYQTTDHVRRYYQTAKT